LTNIKRGYRRSLDATTSLPSFSLADADSRVLSHSVWGATTSSFNARTETSRHPTPENASGGKETPKQRVSFESDHSSLPTMRSVGQGNGVFLCLFIIMLMIYLQRFHVEIEEVILPRLPYALLQNIEMTTFKIGSVHNFVLP
jgi:hypothetical protein